MADISATKSGLILSKFGAKFSGRTGLVSLMDDLGSALNENPEMIFMGGGNPARIPDVEACFEESLLAITKDVEKRHSMLGIYQSPKGDMDFREQLARYLAQHFGWKITRNNIAVSNGSQSAFFTLYNMFAGEMADGTTGTIHLPLSPEYIGYKDTGLLKDLFTATRPAIEDLSPTQFKYRVDFRKLAVPQSVSLMCVSRPTNPTGNVLTDDEMQKLDALAASSGIPFIIDGAYGLPFPSIIFGDATPIWNDNIILVLSLSKIGLPGLRTGIVIASEDVIEAFANVNTVLSLASSTVGPALGKELLRGGELQRLSENSIQPFYHQRAAETVALFETALEGLPFTIHKPEGAIFLWLWFRDLPIPSQDLYERLKARGVLIVPGQEFFVGIEEDWPHKQECIRVSYAQSRETVKAGVAIIADELKSLYR